MSISHAPSIPKRFRKYFWDCDFSALRLPRYRSMAIKHLLEYGGIDAMLWILDHIDRNEVADLLKSHDGSEMERRSYLFWKKIVRMRSLWKR